MPVLFKYTEPLLGVWKIEESSEELLSMLEQSSEYLPFLQQIKTSSGMAGVSCSPERVGGRGVADRLS